MNTRVLLYAICTIVAALAVPPMFGLIPPNHTVGIRIAATLSSPITWYVVHGILGWALFGGSAGLGLWLKRHPNAGHASPLTLLTLGMSLLAGFMLG
jgi:SdpI/YfhL protein family